jgi:hypothetical protein
VEVIPYTGVANVSSRSDPGGVRHGVPVRCVRGWRVRPGAELRRLHGRKFVQSHDKATGAPLWVIEVIDPDPQARTRAVKVKVAAPVQPVIPTGPPGSPFVPVEFTGMTVTPYVNQAGRLAYSLKATGIRAPGRGRPGPETREVAA